MSTYDSLFPAIGRRGGSFDNEERLFVGTQVNADRVVFIDFLREIHHANGSVPAEVEAVFGITTQAGSPGDQVLVITGGEYAESTWNWTPGAPLYLGENGFLTETPPNTGVLLQVAVAVSATNIVFKPSPPIYTGA